VSEPLSSIASVAAPHRHIGKYEVVSLLGHGAMGEVFLAQDPHIGRRVAIKVMKTARPEDHERFLHEARIVGSLSHPNIVVLHDFGFDEERPYLVLEYLTGVSLEAWLRDERSLAEHLRVIEDLLNALTYAHGVGVLHRDLKPSNIQVMPGGQCKLMDFGIARSADGRITATGMVMGTPSYMAPEIVEDALYSTRADMYSAAVVLYEMLSGVNPFHGQTMAATINNVLNLDPPALTDVRPAIPREMSDAVMACLVKDPERRPKDLAPLLAVVQRLRAKPATGSVVLSGQLGMTRTVFGQASTRRRRRERLRKGALVAAAVVLVGGLAWRMGRDSRPAEPVVAAVPLASAPALVAPPATATAVRSESPPSIPAAKPRIPAERPSAIRQDALAMPSAAPDAEPTTAPISAPPQGAEAAPPPALIDRVTPVPREVAPPATLLALRPRLVRRGALVVVELEGASLHPQQKARVLRGREDATAIRVTHQAFLGPTSVRLTLLVDEDAPIGIYSVVLVDAAGGFTNSLTLEVIL